MICAPEFLVCQWGPLFETHFGAPKLSEKNVELTFGTVLSIVGVFTKVLNLVRLLNVIKMSNSKNLNNLLNFINLCVFVFSAKLWFQ